MDAQYYIVSGGGPSWRIAGVFGSRQDAEACEEAGWPDFGIEGPVSAERASEAREIMRPKPLIPAGAAYPSGGAGNRGAIGGF